MSLSVQIPIVSVDHVPLSVLLFCYKKGLMTCDTDILVVSVSLFVFLAYDWRY